MNNDKMKEIAMDKYIKRLHYINQFGELDPLCLAIDCWEQILFQALRDYEIDYKFAFCDDINIKYYTREDRCLICKSSLGLNSSLYNIETLSHNAYDIFNIINKTLDSNKFIAFKTMFDMIPAYTWYKKDSLGNHNTHISTIIGYDENNYYITDSPLVLVKDRCDFHPQNQTIVKINQKIFNDSFSRYCELITIDINEYNITNIYKLDELLYLIVENYYNPTMDNDGDIDIYYGRNALVKLYNSVSNQKFTYLKKHFFSNHFELHILYSRRLILKWCLEAHSCKYIKNIYFEKVIFYLNRSIEEWNTLKLITIKNNYSGVKNYRQLIKKYLKDIIIIEDQLINNLNCMIQQ
ncbi:MAG: hypothetical protein ACPKPY_14300 [Nitrososphaeraceae archaeon]